MAETEVVARSCKCNAGLIEGSLTINGNRVRFYKCPECGSFAYHPSDLQKAAYRQATERGSEKWEEQENTTTKGSG